MFFDALNLTWEYEPQGFLTEDGTGYLADFWLPELQMLVEIKPLDTAEDADGPDIRVGSKERKFADMVNQNEGGDLPEPYTGAMFVVLFGTPGPAGHRHQGRRSYGGTIGWDSPYYLCECKECGSLGFQFDGRDGRNAHGVGCTGVNYDKGTYNIDSPRILRAAEVARAARFEHGQTPT